MNRPQPPAYQCRFIGRGPCVTRSPVHCRFLTGSTTTMDGGRTAYTILVVEDDPASATALARLLRLLGHTVKTAAGIAPALTLAQQERFDLLLCDIALPDGSGCDLMR